jgi:hypothetical protein
MIQQEMLTWFGESDRRAVVRLGAWNLFRHLFCRMAG